ncbi:MAG: leucine-rich repeat domain-containing protein [Lentisphaerae bacterium]|nr:leucine-rich repeat domain-containing protein [Lentisphaerota bacterium]
MLEEKNIFVGGVEYTADRKTLIHFPEDLEIQDYTVPEGTEEIGITAFFNCQQLHSVTLPQSLLEINSNAFQQCCNLQALTIPANVKTIAPNAFLDCPAKLVSESPDFTIDRFGAVVWKDKTLLCIPTELEYYEVPENVIFIGSDVCMFGKLRKIVLPETLLSIGDNAFIGCENLQYVDLPPTLLEVGSNAFYMTACEEEMQAKYPSFFNSDPVKEYIARSIRQVRENGGSFKKINADTAENADWLRQHRKK